jgi:hypothetical protein
MDVFGSMPLWALWGALAVTPPLFGFCIHVLARAMKTGQFGLFGRTIAERAQSPALFWTLLNKSVLVGGFFVFVLISALVELFLARA